MIGYWLATKQENRIDQSLANDFQYTKLKYKQHLYSSLKIPTYVSFMFIFIQFINQSLFPFCLFKLVFL